MQTDVDNLPDDLSKKLDLLRIIENRIRLRFRVCAAHKTCFLLDLVSMWKPPCIDFDEPNVSCAVGVFDSWKSVAW